MTIEIEKHELQILKEFIAFHLGDTDEINSPNSRNQDVDTLRGIINKLKEE